MVKLFQRIGRIYAFYTDLFDFRQQIWNWLKQWNEIKNAEKLLH